MIDTVAEPQACQGTSTEVLDAWGFVPLDLVAHSSWVAGKRVALLDTVSASGGWRRWLLPRQLHLAGMNDPLYIKNLRWLARVRCKFSANNLASESCRTVVSQIEKDLPRTWPGHRNTKAIQTALGAILVPLFAVRNVAVGYTQGLNYPAALLSRAMPNEDAFWSLAALVEHALPNFFSKGSLQGVMINCEVLDWLIRQLSPEIASQLDNAIGYSPALLFVEPLISLLSSAGLPGDAVLQIWQATLKAEKPQLVFLRLLAALYCSAAPAIAELRADGMMLFTEIRTAVEKTFAGLYDTAPIIAAAHADSAKITDAMLDAQYKEAEQRMDAEASRQQARRNRLLLNKIDAGRALPKDLIQRLRKNWHGGPDDEISVQEFVLVMEAAIVDNKQEGAGLCPESPLSTMHSQKLFAEFDVDHSGGLSFREVLLGLALVLNEEPDKRVDAIFAFLDADGNGEVTRSEFQSLANLIKGSGDLDQAIKMFDDLDSDKSGSLDRDEFQKALLVFPSLVAHKVDASFSMCRSTVVEELNRPVHVDDSFSNACQACSQRFTVVHRRHHCRACGRLLCGRCTRNRTPIVVMGYTSPVRVCITCYSFMS